MINISLRQLRYFDALRQHAHFGRAAEACAISQPALSVQIKELEETLGLPLFERSARQVRLTPFGEQFTSRVRAILRSVEELGELARTAQSNLVGRFRLGIIPTIAPYILPDVIRALAAANPDLDLHIRESMTPHLIAELLDGRLDAAILALPVSEVQLDEYPLFREDFLLVRHQARASDPVPSPEHLRHMKLLLLEEGHCFRDQAVSFCGVGSAIGREGLDGSSLTTLVQMVGAGIGVTLIPEMALQVEQRAAPVVVSRFPGGQQPGRNVGMVWRKSTPLIQHLEQFAEVVKLATKPDKNSSN